MLTIPSIGFGTYRLNKEDIDNALTHALTESKYVHIDTAFLYKNQKYIGEVLKTTKINRSNIWITTKIDKFSINSGKKAVVKCLNKCLKDLNTIYLDLVLLHAPANTYELDIEAWKVLEEYQKIGIVKHIGVSNYKEHHLINLMKNTTIKPYTNQIEVSPFCTRDSLVNFCKKNKIIVTAHSSLTKGEKLDNKLLLEIATEHKCTTAQLLLKWSLKNDFVIIPRSHRKDHVDENIELNFDISEENMAKLAELNEDYATHPQYL